MKTKFHPFFPVTGGRVVVSLLVRVAIFVHFGLLGAVATFIGAGEEKADVAEITITAHKSELLFDKKKFTVKAGQKVKLTLVNPDESLNLQPHNLLVIDPGHWWVMNGVMTVED